MTLDRFEKVLLCPILHDAGAFDQTSIGFSDRPESSRSSSSAKANARRHKSQC